MAKARLGRYGAAAGLLTGVAAVLGGAVTLFSFEPILQSVFQKALVLEPGSDTFRIWRDTPIPMYMNFYLFNWTNPRQLGLEPPALAQTGPYRFNVREEKTDVEWNDNGTVSYRVARRWFFDPLRSNGTLNDTVTTLNPVSLSAAHTAREWSAMLKTPISVTLATTGQRITVTKQVGELLFDGYTDPLLDMALKLPSFAGVHIPFDKFGWFYMRNSSSDFEGTFNMDTGERGIADYGKVWRWNHDTETGFYDGSCGKVFGSAGELFPPGQSKTEPIHMFSADLCRTMRLDYDSEAEMHGIQGYRYVGGAWNVDNGTLDPGNRCFCSGQCSPSGVLNVTKCRFGAPGFVSYPHFLHGDPVLGRQVTGMHPDPNKHSLYITIEPSTGIPLDVAARFQINLLLSPIDGIALYRDVPRVFFPMMWFEQRAYISEELAAELSLVLRMPSVARVASAAALTLGALTLVITACLLCDPAPRRKASKKEEVHLPEHALKPLIKRNNVLTTSDKNQIILQNGNTDKYCD